MDTRARETPFQQLLQNSETILFDSDFDTSQHRKRRMGTRYF